MQRRLQSPISPSHLQEQKILTSQNCVSQQFLSSEIISNIFWIIVIMIMHITSRQKPVQS